MPGSRGQVGIWPPLLAPHQPACGMPATSSISPACHHLHRQRNSSHMCRGKNPLQRRWENVQPKKKKNVRRLILEPAAARTQPHPPIILRSANPIRGANVECQPAASLIIKTPNKGSSCDFPSTPFFTRVQRGQRALSLSETPLKSADLGAGRAEADQSGTCTTPSAWSTSARGLCLPLGVLSVHLSQVVERGQCGKRTQAETTGIRSRSMVRTSGRTYYK